MRGWEERRKRELFWHVKQIILKKVKQLSTRCSVLKIPFIFYVSHSLLFTLTVKISWISDQAKTL